MKQRIKKKIVRCNQYLILGEKKERKKDGGKERKKK